VHYKPLTYYQPYADRVTPPVTEREWRRLVTLPMFAGMTEAEQGQVIEAVKEWCAK
jgi:dTDP-4-amino-4,6-dideoxygalactose transaminase